MRRLFGRAKTPSLRSLLLTLLAVGLLLIVEPGHQSASSASTAGQTPTGREVSGTPLDKQRRGLLTQLYKQLKSHEPFTDQESSILVRFKNGEPVSPLEADVVISRALYVRDVLQQDLNAQQKDLARQYDEFIAQTINAVSGAQCETCAHYVAVAAVGGIVPGTTDTGNHCDDCPTLIALPFAFTFYNQTYTDANVNSNGNLQFGSNNPDIGGCLPVMNFHPTIFAYYGDLTTQDAASGQGIFTSISGTAPNRIFNIEWRARQSAQNGSPTLNFEIRLYEGQTRFDIIFGQMTLSSVHGTVGAQGDLACFTQLYCNAATTTVNGATWSFLRDADPHPLPNYMIGSSTGATIVPGTTDVGNHCDGCLTPIALPFPYKLYDQTFGIANVSSHGNLQFSQLPVNHLAACFPQPGYRYSIFAFHDNLTTQDAASGQGIFTSVSGTAPNRIFNIEWRARQSAQNGSPTYNFEIRLYEGQTRFDIIYGALGASSFTTTVGVQYNENCFDVYDCHQATDPFPGLDVTFTLASVCELICPLNITTSTAVPGSPTAVVTYPAPTANCPGGTVVCNPPSGTAFPVGTTTVTCTATGTSGATGTCSFTVTVFNACVQDDANPSRALVFSTATGDYRFCCGGTTYTGKGKVTVRGSLITLEASGTDRRVTATVDGATGKGSASLQSPPGNTLCTIRDTNLFNNSCNCQ